MIEYTSEEKIAALDRMRNSISPGISALVERNLEAVRDTNILLKFSSTCNAVKALEFHHKEVEGKSYHRPKNITLSR